MMELRPIQEAPGYYVCEQFVWSKRIGEWPYKMIGYTSDRGYLYVRLTVNCKVVAWRVHRLIALVWLGPPPPDKPVVLHKDDNPANNHYLNLKYGTCAENSRQMVERNRQNSPIGLRHGRRKLSEFDVLDIRQRRSDGETYEEIAETYNVARETVCAIIRRKLWKHI